jgi:hypothetical protein
VHRFVTLHLALFGACVLIGIVGCSTSGPLSSVPSKLVVVTNAVPFLNAAAGAAAATPQTAPLSPLFAAAGALLAALGGWAARHYSTPPNGTASKSTSAPSEKAP